MAQNSKATPKPLQNSKLLKIKHFVKFFGVLEFTPKTALPSPTHPLPHPYPISSFFLYIPLSLQTLQNKKQKTKQIIGRVGLDSFGVVFGVALEWLWSFLHFCKKHMIIKHHPPPHPLPSTAIKPLKIKRCMMLIKPLKLKHLIRFLLS
jgi:hypothetical protein